MELHQGKLQPYPQIYLTIIEVADSDKHKLGYSMDLIAAIKCFIVQAPLGENVTKGTRFLN